MCVVLFSFLWEVWRRWLGGDGDSSLVDVRLEFFALPGLLGGGWKNFYNLNTYQWNLF